MGAAAGFPGVVAVKVLAPESSALTSAAAARRVFLCFTLVTVVDGAKCDDRCARFRERTGTHAGKQWNVGAAIFWKLCRTQMNFSVF